MKLKNLFSRIPRPVRACICTVLAIALLLSYYVMLGCPLLTMKQHFCRAEKVHMVGPSEIVDVIPYEQYGEYDRLYVAESANGVTFFGRYYSSSPYDDPFEEKLYHFVYIEKSEDMTLCVAPNVWGSFWDFGGFLEQLPVYLFTEEQHGVRAELNLTVKFSGGSNSSANYEVPFFASADRSKEGFYRFGLSSDKEQGWTALYYLSSALGGEPHAGVYVSNYLADLTQISAVIRLYDADGQLITENSRILYSGQ